jgi:hypothetical protein
LSQTLNANPIDVLDDLLENEAIADDEVLLKVNGRKVTDSMKLDVTVGRIRRLAMNEDVWRYSVFAACFPLHFFIYYKSWDCRTPDSSTYFSVLPGFTIRSTG